MSVCEKCGHETREAKIVKFYGMFEAHLFHRYEGSTLDEIVWAWLAHCSTPNPAIVGGREVEDLGPTSLCPVAVLDGNGKDLRRVGKMVWFGKESTYDDLLEWKAAAEADPDVIMLLSAQGGQQNG